MRLGEDELWECFYLLFDKSYRPVYYTKRWIFVYAKEKNLWDFRFSRRRVWSLESPGMYRCVVTLNWSDVTWLLTQHVPLKRRSTSTWLHADTPQETLNLKKKLERLFCTSVKCGLLPWPTRTETFYQLVRFWLKFPLGFHSLCSYAGTLS
jgi:hypothetical protein